MDKRTSVRFFTYFIFIVIAVIVIFFVVRLGRDTYKGHDAFEAGPVKVGERSPNDTVTSLDINSKTITQTKKSETLEPAFEKSPTFQKQRSSAVISHKTNPIPLKDTVPAITTHSQGNYNHLINGNNNNVGINGDVNINAEKRLLQKDKLTLVHFVDSVAAAKGMGKKMQVWVIIEQYSNGQTFASDLVEFLENQNYHVVTGQSMSGTMPIKGAEIKATNMGVCIYVGQF